MSTCNLTCNCFYCAPPEKGHIERKNLFEDCQCINLKEQINHIEEVAFNLGLTLNKVREERDCYREALEMIHKFYRTFDEPASIRVARELLARFPKPAPTGKEGE